MNPARKIQLSAIALVVVSLACAITPAASTPDAGAISTAAAQTVIAGITQNAVQATPSNVFISTYTSAPPLLSPTETATSTESLTPTQTTTPTQTLTATPAYTATPPVPLISVSTPTNCRNGPGKVYDMEGALLIGQFAEVYGRDPTNKYWYIRNPEANPEFCWVWGEYATLTGSTLLVPVFTPPPTPTPTNTPLPTFTPTPVPAFKADFVSLDSCSGNWWVKIMLKNNGTIPFRSVYASVQDKVTDVTVVNLSDGFTNMDGCLVKTTKDVLGLDDTYLLSIPSFTYSPAGHEIHMILSLCSSTGQKGTCLTKKFDFTP
jgi:hypothetical protein